MTLYPIHEPLRSLVAETPAKPDWYTQLIRIEIRVTPMLAMRLEDEPIPDLHDAVWADAYVSTLEASEGRYIAHFLRSMMRQVLRNWFNTDQL